MGIVAGLGAAAVCGATLALGCVAIAGAVIGAGAGGLAHMGAARLMGERITNRKIVKWTLGSMIGDGVSGTLAGIGLKGAGVVIGIYRYKKAVPRLTVRQEDKNYVRVSKSILFSRRMWRV